MSDDEFSIRRRRRMRDPSDDEEEEEESSFRSRRRRGRDDSDEDEPVSNARVSDEEEEEQSGGAAAAPGTTLGKIMESRRKKIQQNLIEGMFKLAEKKYGRKRPQRGDKGNAMEDYELYLRSLKAKVKTSQDKLNGVLKQKKDIEAKVAQAERDFNTHQSKYDKAEEEKQNAINDGRDPELPKDFIVPQRAKKANAGLGALVMKASAGMWEEKFSAMRKAKSSSNTPEWMAKQKKSDKTSALLKVGKTATEKKGSRRRRKDEDDKPNAFTVNLKKTGLRKEEEEPARRPRRGRGGDSDED